MGFSLRRRAATGLTYGLVVGLVAVFSLSAVEITGREVACLFDEAAASMSLAEVPACRTAGETGGRQPDEPPVDLSFTVPDLVGVPGGQPIISDPVTMPDAAFDLAVSGAELSLNDAPFQPAGTYPVAPRDQARLRVTPPAGAGWAPLDIQLTGSIAGEVLHQDTWTLSPPARDVGLGTLRFTDLEDVIPGGPIRSGPQFLAGSYSDLSLSVVNGPALISVNGAAAVASVSVNPGQRLHLEIPDPLSFGAAVTSRLVLVDPADGEPLWQGTWAVSMAARDVEPDPFTFRDLQGVLGGSTAYSDTIRLQGINDLVDVSVTVDSGAVDLQVNGGANVGTLRQGDLIRLFLTTPGGFGWADRVATITLTDPLSGERLYQTTWRVSAAARDVGLTPFTFADSVKVFPGDLGYSGAVSIAGTLNTTLNYTIQGPSGAYLRRLRNGSFTDGTSGDVQNGDILLLVAPTPAGVYDWRGTVSLILSDPQDDAPVYTTSWTVGTVERVLDLHAFTFRDTTGVMGGATAYSDTVLISGINTPVAVAATVNAGSVSLQVNGGGTASTVKNGDYLRLNLTAPGGFGWPDRIATVTITDPQTGTLLHQTTWRVSAAARDVGLSPLVFPDAVGFFPGDLGSSTALSVEGTLNTSLTYTLDGPSGAYLRRLRNGQFAQGTSGELQRGDIIQLFSATPAGHYSWRDTLTLSLTDPQDGAALFTTSWTVGTQARDVGVNAFTFNDSLGFDPGALANSDAKSIDGTLNTAIAYSVEGPSGAYLRRLRHGAFATGTSGDLLAGDNIQLFVPTDNAFSWRGAVLLTLSDPLTGEVLHTIPWTAGTVARDVGFTRFTIADTPNQAPGALIASGSYSIDGTLNTALAYEITGASGAYLRRLRNSSFTTGTSGDLQRGDILTLFVQAPNQFGWSGTVSLTIRDPLTGDLLDTVSWTASTTPRNVDVTLPAWQLASSVIAHPDEPYVYSNSEYITGSFNDTLQLRVTGPRNPVFQVPGSGSYAQTISVKDRDVTRIRVAPPPTFSTQATYTIELLDPLDGSVLASNSWTFSSIARDTQVTLPSWQLASSVVAHPDEPYVYSNSEYITGSFNVPLQLRVTGPRNPVFQVPGSGSYAQTISVNDRDVTRIRVAPPPTFSTQATYTIEVVDPADGSTLRSNTWTFTTVARNTQVTLPSNISQSSIDSNYAYFGSYYFSGSFNDELLMEISGPTTGYTNIQFGGWSTSRLFSPQTGNIHIQIRVDRPSSTGTYSYTLRALDPLNGNAVVASRPFTVTVP